MGTLIYMAPEQTKNHSYGKVKPICFIDLEDRYVGLWYHNVHAYIGKASTI